MRSTVFERAFAVFLIFVISPLLSAQTASTATISGRVLDNASKPIASATITLVEAGRTATTGADGTFTFSAIPAGHYHVVVETRRSGSTVAEAELAAGQTRTLEITLDPLVHSEEIVVSASPDTRRASEVYQPVNVVSSEEVAERLQPTLGETLREEPGVNATYFGPGSSRPIIRGLGADRIRVLSEGVGSNDASNVSPDHAVSVDPANAEQIEIVRGPATLLYGSNAVGGVVNVLDQRIPDAVPQDVTGHVDLRFGTVADERNGGFSLTGGSGSFAWHADLSLRETDDYEIPGPADEHDDDPDELTGFLTNSSLDMSTGTIGGSFVGTRGFLGIAWNRFDTNYGVPGHGHHEEEGAAIEEEEEGVRIDLDQQRLDLKGEIRELGIFRSVRLRAGRTEYEHRELEGSVVGTRFTSEGFEGRVDATHRQFGRLRGSLGVQYSDVDLVASGEEAFIPANATRSAAVFAFEEFTGKVIDVQFGARFERNDTTTPADLPDRSFSGLSISGGAILHPIEGYALALSAARAVRAPTTTELYANGPHAATSQFEIGDPLLDEEISTGLDLSLRKTAGRLRGELNIFQNRFAGYIFERATGEEEDGMPVFQYGQEDARFHGAELDLHLELWHAGENHLELEGGADFVRARLDSGENLARIPPRRYSLGLRWQASQLSASAEAWRYDEQTRLAPLEEPTGSSTVVNATLSYRLLSKNLVHDLMLRGTNLTDELVRLHTSPLKDRAPLPGRDVTLSYRVSF